MQETTRENMKIPINLASQPFRRDRAMLVASAAVSLLLVGTLGALISLAMTDRAQLADLRAQVSRIRSLLRASADQQQSLEGVLRQPQNAEVLERSVFLNTLLYRKGISWTKILADLEKTMPAKVKVLNIRPFPMGKGQVTLDMLVQRSPTKSVLLRPSGKSAMRRRRLRINAPLLSQALSVTPSTPFMAR